MTSRKKTETCGNMELVELSPVEIKLHRLKNRLEKDGPWKTFLRVLSKIRPNHKAPKQTLSAAARSRLADDEVLNLQPGEWIAIKPAEEIQQTLDAAGKHRGLSFMPEMWKYCGKQYRVYKRVNKIVIIGTESLKQIKNTVLLEGVNCDGSHHSDCDCACFHYWREAWLRRIPAQKNTTDTIPENRTETVPQ